MMMKRFLAALALTASVALTALPASAQWSPNKPPAPRYEPHGDRAGYIWEHGHWLWHTDHWIWLGGYWVRMRCGDRWVPGHYIYGPYGSRWRPGHCR